MSDTANPHPLRLDRSKYHASEHGDHPDRMRFRQDGLPFDARGHLCTELCSAEDVARADDKAARAKAHELETPEPEDAAADDGSVNLERWGRGEAHYEPGRVFAAIRHRYNKFVRTFADAIDFLVFDACLIPEAEASRKLFESHERPRLPERS